MTDQSTTMTIGVSDEDVAREVALGILGRAQDIHENPDDEFEDIALELRDIGQEQLATYDESYTG